MYQEMPSLCEAYAKYFKIGAAVMPQNLTAQRNLIIKHFNSLTTSSAMKFGPIHPEEYRYDFADADAIIAFAKEHHMGVRAHAPVWHQQTEDWIFTDRFVYADRELLLERLEDHIKVLAGRYGDSVYAWDVVNEAIVDDPDGYLRETKWYKLIGPDYIDYAYRFVKKYAPKTQVFYNDYNEFNPIKRDKIVKFMRGMQERGVPLDGFGLQQHVSIYTDLDDIKAAIEAYAALGITLHVTELDVSLYHPKDRPNPYYPKRFTIPSREDFERQGKMYEDLFVLYRSYSDVIESVTTWGVADDLTWLDMHPVPGRKNYPLLFSYDHTPKPCTRAIVDAVR